MSDHTESIGQRVAARRKELGRSRKEVADALDMSERWVKAIELGTREIVRFVHIQGLADFLKMDLAELTGTPFREHHTEGKHGLDAIPGIRRALLRGQLPARPRGGPLDLTDLRSQVDQAHHHRRHGQYGDLGLILPRLLDDTADTAAVLDGDAAADALVLVAEARHDAAMMTKKLGLVDLAAVAASQSTQAATASGDVLWTVAAAWTEAEVYFSAGAVPEGLELIQSTLDRLDGMLGDDDPRVWSMWGTLHLLAALGEAQWKNRAEAEAHLAEADRAVAANGFAERDDFQDVFGPANTALNAVSTRLELGDGLASLDAMTGVEWKVLPKERRARHLIDVGRAKMSGKRDDEAMRALLDASRLAPEYTHAHTLVRDMVLTALNRERVSSRTPVRAMARRIGID